MRSGDRNSYYIEINRDAGVKFLHLILFNLMVTNIDKDKNKLKQTCICYCFFSVFLLFVSVIFPTSRHRFLE